MDVRISTVAAASQLSQPQPPAPVTAAAACNWEDSDISLSDMQQQELRQEQQQPAALQPAVSHENAITFLSMAGCEDMTSTPKVSSAEAGRVDLSETGQSCTMRAAAQRASPTAGTSTGKGASAVSCAGTACVGSASVTEPHTAPSGVVPTASGAPPTSVQRGYRAMRHMGLTVSITPDMEFMSPPTTLNCPTSIPANKTDIATDEGRSPPQPYSQLSVETGESTPTSPSITPAAIVSPSGKTTGHVHLGHGVGGLHSPHATLLSSRGCASAVKLWDRVPLESQRLRPMSPTPLGPYWVPRRSSPGKCSTFSPQSSVCPSPHTSPYSTNTSPRQHVLHPKDSAQLGTHLTDSGPVPLDKDVLLVPEHVLPAFEVDGTEWTVGRLLGEGAYSKVFTVLNKPSGKLAAVKVMESSPSAVTHAQVMKDLERYRLLRNAHIARYTGCHLDPASGQLYVLMDLAPGGSVHQLLCEFGPLPEAITRSYTRQLLLGLEYLHARKVVHQGVRGSNILVGLDCKVKLADYGSLGSPCITDISSPSSRTDQIGVKLASPAAGGARLGTAVSETAGVGAAGAMHAATAILAAGLGTRENATAGSSDASPEWGVRSVGGLGLGLAALSRNVLWIPPEVAQGKKYGRRGDIWSLGCTVIEMLTGQPPWSDLATNCTPWGAMFKIGATASGPPRPPHLSQEASSFLDDCLTVNPRERPMASQLLQHPWIAGISGDPD